MSKRLPVFCLMWILFLTAHGQQHDFQTIDFRVSDSIAAVYKGRNLKDPRGLAIEMVKGVDTNVEKFRVIYRWIADNISYDVEMYRKDQTNTMRYRHNRSRLGQWKKHFARRSKSRLFHKMIAVCSGYAMLLEYMCNAVGIPVVTIDGYARTETSTIGKRDLNHAWNVVRLNDKWYLCDVTWSSGFVTERDKFIRRFNSMYFLTEPEFFMSDHYPRDRTWLLVFPKPSLSEFVHGPIKCSGFVTNRINHYEPQRGIINGKKGEELEFRFTKNTADILTVAYVLEDGKTTRGSWVTLKFKKDGYYSFTHTCLDAGSFHLYIFINGQNTFRYDLVVR